MNNEFSNHFRDISADHYDLAAARSWMSNICGPHQLKASKPNSIQFHHSGNVLKSMSTTLGYVEYGTDVTVGVVDTDSFNSYSLSLPVTGEQELSKAGQLLHSDCNKGVIVSPNECQELSITGDCRKLQVVISREAMGKTLEDMLQRPLGEPIRFAPCMDAMHGAAASWWRTARHFIDELERSDLYSDLFFSRDIESTLIKGLILAQPNNYSEELRRSLSVKLPHYLVRAKDFIHANARESLSLEDLEQIAGVSRFKLFDGFKKYFGVSPMAYLKQHRLKAVRQDILEDRTARNISEIAMGWGFTHLGRFSCEYRKLFGETPSMTSLRLDLRRNRLY